MLLLLRRSVPVSARACRRLYSTTPRQPLPEPPAVRELDSLESRQLAREWIARLEQSHYERIPKGARPSITALSARIRSLTSNHFIRLARNKLLAIFRPWRSERQQAEHKSHRSTGSHVALSLVAAVRFLISSSDVKLLHVKPRRRTPLLVFRSPYATRQSPFVHAQDLGRARARIKS